MLCSAGVREGQREGGEEVKTGQGEGGDGGRGKWVGPGGGLLSSTDACHVISPFLGLIHQDRSTQTCTRDIAGMGLS